MVPLSSLLSGVFVLTGLWHLAAGIGCTPARRRWRQWVDSTLHVLMSCAMLAMLWPGAWPGPVPVEAQVAVFGAGAGWFLLAPDARTSRWYDAAAMAAMTWMLLVMGPADADRHAHHLHGTGSAGGDGPGWQAAVTLAFAGVLVVGVVHSLGDWIGERAAGRSTRPRSARGLVAALMGAGMALSLLPLV